MTQNRHNASTTLNYSPRKAMLVINQIRGKSINQALEILKYSPKGKTKKIAHVVLNAANNLALTEADYDNYFISKVVAEEAQRLYRVEPRARGSAFRVRRRYSRIRVWLEKN